MLNCKYTRFKNFYSVHVYIFAYTYVWVHLHVCAHACVTRG